MNGSVKFIKFADVTLDTKGVISTPNIFVHEWGTYPTIIGPTVSNYTCRVYIPITSQKGFHQRCNHKCMRLKWVETKRVDLEGHLARVCQDMRDDVAMNYTFTPMNNSLGDASSNNSPRSSLSNDSDSSDNWVHISGYN